MTALIVGGLSWWHGRVQDWSSGGNVRATITACPQPEEHQLGYEGAVTVALHNVGTDRREAKVAVLVLGGRDVDVVVRRVRTTLNPSQTGTFELGYRLGEAEAVRCAVIEPPVERPPGSERRDPDRDEACWGDPVTGRIAYSYSDGAGGGIAGCATPVVPR